MRARGKWMRHPRHLAGCSCNRRRRKRRKGKSTCQFLRNESVNGEAAAVYSMRRETEIANEDGLIWISKTSGTSH